MKTKIMKTRTPLCAAALTVAALALAIPAAHAATITWNTKQTATGNASDVVTTGTFFDSAAAYTPTNVFLNGVTFNRNVGGGAFDSSGITWVVNPDVGDDAKGIGSFATPASFDPEYQKLGGTTIFSQNFMTINITGLTIGQEYLTQIWAGTWLFGPWNTSYTAGNSSGDLFANNSPDAGEYVVGTFTADATTQTITAAGFFAMTSAMQVRAIPEPSAALLGGLGLLALLRRRR